MSSFDPPTLDDLAETAWAAIHGGSSTSSAPETAPAVDWSTYQTGAYDAPTGEANEYADDDEAFTAEEEAALDAVLESWGLEPTVASIEDMLMAAGAVEQQAAEDSAYAEAAEAERATEAWLAERGFSDASEVVPYIELADAEVAAGRLDADAAFDVGVQAAERARDAMDNAKRRQSYTKWDQMDAAVDDVFERIHGPQQTYTATPDQNARGWEKSFDQALGKVLEAQSVVEAIETNADAAVANNYSERT
jgi:hypothetical protein